MQVQGVAYRSGIGHTEAVPTPREPRPIRQREKKREGLDWATLGGGVTPSEAAKLEALKLDERRRKNNAGKFTMSDADRRTAARRGGAAARVVNLAQSAKRNEQIVARWHEGVNANKLGREFKLGFYTIRKILNEAGIELVSQQKPRLPIDPKQCAWCEDTFNIREGERRELYKTRVTCSRKCAGHLAASKRKDTK